MFPDSMIVCTRSAWRAMTCNTSTRCAMLDFCSDKIDAANRVLPVKNNINMLSRSSSAVRDAFTDSTVTPSPGPNRKYRRPPYAAMYWSWTPIGFFRMLISISHASRANFSAVTVAPTK